MPSLVHTVYPGIEIEARLPSVTGLTQNKIYPVTTFTKRENVLAKFLSLPSYHFYHYQASINKLSFLSSSGRQGKACHIFQFAVPRQTRWRKCSYIRLALQPGPGFYRS